MSRQRIDLRNCVCETGGPSGGVAGLSDVVVNIASEGVIAPPSTSARSTPKRARKPRSKGKGSHCVISHKGKVVHCYEDRATAARVAEAFTKRGRAGTEFRVEDR